MGCEEVKHNVFLNVNDLRSIVEWLDSLKVEYNPNINIILTPTGIADAIEVKVTTKDGEGIWKDFTDYESW